MALFCPQCGAATTPGTAFCASCGAAMTAGPAPYAPGPMAAAPSPLAPAPRPTGVTAIGVACFVLAAFGGFSALAVLFVGSLVGSAASFGNAPFGAFLGSLFLLIVLIVLAVAGLFVAVGIGMLRGRDWARVTAIILAVLVGLGQLGSAVSELSSIGKNGNGGNVFVSLLFLAGAIFAVYYLVKPDVKAWFAAQPR